MAGEKTVVTGVVLRVTDTKEADRILTVLSPALGRIGVIARGARRRNSRVAAACQLLAYDELTVYKKGGWYLLDEANTIELFDGVRQELTLLALSAWFAELAECAAPEDSPAPELTSLLLNALYALCYLHKAPTLVKAAFQWRLLALMGFQPLVERCFVCGSEAPVEPVLDMERGAVRCGGCAGGGRCAALTAGGLAALRHIVSTDSRRLYSFTLHERELRALDEAGETFLSAQLERRFRTLDYYKSLAIQ